MNIHGYCIRCRRIKRVHVSIPPRPGAVAVGTCSECDDKRRGLRP